MLCVARIRTKTSETRRAHYSQGAVRMQGEIIKTPIKIAGFRDGAVQNPHSMRVLGVADLVDAQFTASGCGAGAARGDLVLPQTRKLVHGSSALQLDQALVEVRAGFDAAEVIFERDVLVRGMSIFVRQAEAHEHAGNFKRVVHLRDKGNRAAFANKNCLLAEAFFERFDGRLENGMGVGRGPRLAFAEDFKSAGNARGQKLSNIFFNELGDFVGVLIRHYARRKFSVSVSG